MKVVALAGGVGGAKLIDGLYNVLDPGELSVVVNTGDDFKHIELYISPDLDTVCYTIAKIANPKTGWGRVDESFNALKTISELDGPTWFQLGDKDIGLHLFRTMLINEGLSLSEVTKLVCNKLDIGCEIFPMTDDFVQTQVETREYGLITFQEYFVKYQYQPFVEKFIFNRSDTAKPAPGMIQKIEEADIVIICPSNPWVSIGPILSIKEIYDALKKKKVMAVSPLIQGTAVKGPTAKIYHELGINPTTIAIAKHYKELLSGLVIDNLDVSESQEIKKLGIHPFIANIMMPDISERVRLAQEVLKFSEVIRKGIL